MNTKPTTTDEVQNDKADATSAESQSITKDDAFHVLQNPRRRATLRYLLEHDQDQCHMRELAEEVAAWEHDTTIRQLSSDQRQRVYIALYQSHLPKLDDYGVINYNQSHGIVDPLPLIQVFTPYLENGLHADDADLTVSNEETSDRKLSTAVSTIFRR